jgi:type IV secretory pathway VirB10-like protein
MTGEPVLDQQMYGPIRPPPSHRAVRVRLIPWLLGIIIMIGFAIGAYLWARHAGWLTPVDRLAKGYMDNNGIGIKPGFHYTPEVKPAVAVTNGRDVLQEQLDALKRQVSQLAAAFEAHLKNHPKGGGTAAQPVAKPAPAKHRSMMFVSNKVEMEDIPEPDTYELAPGATKLPCVVETAMNSDVQSHFTAKVRNDVYDTATGHRLLVPQGSTILGEYKSASLVFGNERLPSLGLTLALRDGRSVDLGDAPVLNHEGMAGLVSRVNQHWWRNIGAILIMGVLRGGQQAIITEVGSTTGTGAVASGIGTTVGQFGVQKLNRAIDTRPTIEVDAGSLCQLLLLKPLRLPAIAER